MNTAQLGTILYAIRTGRGEERDDNALCRSLARHVADVTGVAAVGFRCVLFDRDQVQPEPSAKVIGGNSTDPQPEMPDAVRNLRFFGRAVVLGDMREVSYTLLRGPMSSESETLNAGQVCLVARIRLEQLLCWVLVCGDESLERDEVVASWVSALRIIVREAITRLAVADPDRLRKEFYDTLTDYQPLAAQLDLEYTCNAWLNVCNADWCWLWLHNSLTDEFELAAVASQATSNRPHLPEKRTVVGEGGLGDFSRKTRRSTIINDVQSWKMEHEGKPYRVLMADVLSGLGVRALDHIPLFAPQTTNAPTRSPILGLVSLHYRSPTHRIRHNLEDLTTMGRLTGLCLQHSKKHEQNEILLELNRIAQSHLAQTRKRTTETRKDYLNDLISLVKGHLNVGCVSIFCRVPFQDVVQCVATTGLKRHDGTRVLDDRLSTVVYKAGQRNTGKCFAEARPIVQQYDEDLITSEFSQIDPNGGPHPALFVPILDSPGQTQEGSQATGVIRCVEHTSPLFPREFSSFDDTEVEKLQVIAEQVGPVLHTFEHRIARERTIIIVKHDLAVPFVMMRDTIERLKTFEGEATPPKGYLLLNLEASNRMTAALIDTLEPDPIAQHELNTMPTFLEGDIIARLKAMMSHYARVEKAMQIEFDGFRDIPELEIDPSLVERAVYNLLVNAIKYGARGSTIKVQAQAGNTEYYIDIMNDGIGVSDDEAEHIFLPGLRGHKAKHEAQGLGLGLGIARDAMRRTGGDLRLTSLKNPTVFTLVFPRQLTLR